MPDWIDSFMTATDGLRSPASFRLWGAIGTVAATLERRVWTHTDVDPLFPNLYTVLCGNPSSGKTLAVNEARKMLGPIDRLFLGPDAPTPEAFLDAVFNSMKTPNGTGSSIFSAVTILCREFGVLIPSYNDAFFATLADIYDNPSIYTAPRRDKTRSVTLEAPTVNILAAATPDAIGKLPEAAWGEGFTSRVIFIYGFRPHDYRDILRKRNQTPMTELQKQLTDFFENLHGEFSWEDDAHEALNYWWNVEKLAPVPTYGRLVNYAGRRDTHVVKLSMISAVSAGNGLIVTLKDFRRAQKWLFEAENQMPNIFRAMSAKSDAWLVEDLHRYLRGIYGSVDKDKRQPLDERIIWSYMENKTTSEKILGIIKLAEKTGKIKSGGFGHTWIPAPLDAFDEDGATE